MGTEYKLQFAVPDPDRVTSLLRRLPTAREMPPPYQQQVGLGGSSGEWPAAVVAEADGLYFCDHCGGTGPERLGVVVAWLVGEFGAVTVSEL